MNWRLAAIAVVLGALIGIPAAAYAQPAQTQPTKPKATPSRSSDDDDTAKKPMKVRLVRSNQPGCEPSCAEWISAEGSIDSSSPEEFRKALARLGNRKLPILIQSPGGSMDPSFEIARMIRAKGLDVAVTKTILAPCSRTDTECLKAKAAGFDLGKAEAKVSYCASSCAFILAGGVNRYVGAWTVVGLHEARSIQVYRIVRERYRIDRTGYGPARKQVVDREAVGTKRVEKPADEAVYERARQFFEEMGVSENIMAIMRYAPHEGIRWMKASELTSTKIATHLINGEQLLKLPAGTVIPKPAPAIVTAPPKASDCPTDGGLLCAEPAIPSQRPASAAVTAPAQPAAAAVKPPADCPTGGGMLCIE